MRKPLDFKCFCAQLIPKVTKNLSDLNDRENPSIRDEYYFECIKEFDYFEGIYQFCALNSTE